MSRALCKEEEAVTDLLSLAVVSLKTFTDILLRLLLPNFCRLLKPQETRSQDLEACAASRTPRYRRLPLNQ